MTTGRESRPDGAGRCAPPVLLWAQSRRYHESVCQFLPPPVHDEFHAVRPTTIKVSPGWRPAGRLRPHPASLNPIPALFARTLLFLRFPDSSIAQPPGACAPGRRGVWIARPAGPSIPRFATHCLDGSLVTGADYAATTGWAGAGLAAGWALSARHSVAGFWAGACCRQNLACAGVQRDGRSWRARRLVALRQHQTSTDISASQVETWPSASQPRHAVSSYLDAGDCTVSMHAGF